MKRLNTKKGYAILFTLVVVSIISSIAIGVANSVSKQLVLSSLAHDSQMAFYAADTAAECALYASESTTVLNALGGLPQIAISGAQFYCGVDDNGSSFGIDVATLSPTFYTFNANPSLGGSCFTVNIDQSLTPQKIIEIKGYNTCDTNSQRQVERGILVEY